jgi:hypothetical protein
VTTCGWCADGKVQARRERGREGNHVNHGRGRAHRCCYPPCCCAVLCCCLWCASSRQTDGLTDGQRRPRCSVLPHSLTHHSHIPALSRRQPGRGTFRRPLDRGRLGSEKSRRCCAATGRPPSLLWFGEQRIDNPPPPSAQSNTFVPFSNHPAPPRLS